jgi:hypothetical protein
MTLHLQIVCRNRQLTDHLATRSTIADARIRRKGAKERPGAPAHETTPQSWRSFDAQLAVNERGIQRVLETLQKSDEIAADQEFELRKFTDLSFWQSSREKK